MIIDVRIEVERVDGMNASRAAIEQALCSLVEEGGTLSVEHGEHDSEYEIVGATVIEHTPGAFVRDRRPRR